VSDTLEMRTPACLQGAELSPVEEKTSFPVIRIQPTKGCLSIGIRELWEFRELLYFLTWRDIKVRYKQTSVGIVWILFQPFAMMLVFTIFFGVLAKIPSGGIPYPVFVFSGLLPWQFFSRTIAECANSLIFDQRLIAKVYFPRLLVPSGKILAGLIDFVISLILLFLLMCFYRVMPGNGLLWMPFFILMMAMATTGIGYWVAALNVEYRDLGVAFPFLVQLWMFVTPVVYPSEMVPERWRLLYALNPMAGVVEGFRWSLFGSGNGISDTMIAVSCVVSVAFLVSGLFWFRRQERTFADILG
jgi:lipopolysaccharide transport system permease protein